MMIMHIFAYLTIFIVNGIHLFDTSESRKVIPSICSLAIYSVCSLIFSLIVNTIVTRIVNATRFDESTLSSLNAATGSVAGLEAEERFVSAGSAPEIFSEVKM
jgi:hypothetical protein